MLHIFNIRKRLKSPKILENVLDFLSFLGVFIAKFTSRASRRSIYQQNAKKSPDFSEDSLFQIIIELLLLLCSNYCSSSESDTSECEASLSTCLNVIVRACIFFACTSVRVSVHTDILVKINRSVDCEA